MKNFKKTGEIVTLPAPYDLASGEGVLVGALFGVAQTAALSGADVALELYGEIDLPKTASQAWTVGQKVYWDAANKRATSGASGNTLIGAATLAVGGTAGETTGRVRLNGVAV